MKKKIVSILATLVLLFATSVWAIPPIPPQAGVSLSDSTWTLHNSYPAACGAGDFVTAIGDTLTCDTPPAGDVVGPASSTDNAIARFDLTTGKLLQNSDATLDDNENMSLPATYGANIVTNGTFTTDLTGWAGAGWAQSAGTALHTAGAATALTQAAATVTADTTYRLTWDVVGGTAGTVTASAGGLTGTARAFGSASYSWYFTAAATTALAFTPTSTFDGAIDNVVLQAMTDATGDLTVDGNLTVRSPAMFNSRIILPYGVSTKPSLAIGDDSTGIFATQNLLWTTTGIVINGTIYQLSDAYYMGASSDLVLVRAAANHFALRNSTNPQTFSLYETYTDASNYEYYSLDTGVTTNDTLTIKGNTLGTGGDNLNIALTPAGTGQVTINGATVTGTATDGSGDCTSGMVCLGDHTHTAYAPLASPTFTGTITTPLHIHNNTTETCGSGEGADLCTDPLTEVVYVTTTAATTDVMAIANATAGMFKFIELKTDGGADLSIVPTNFANGTSITLDTAGESVMLHFDGTNWIIAYSFGGVVNP